MNGILSKEEIMGLVSNASKDSKMSIMYPSDAQPSVAPARDFYVIGRFEGISVPSDAIMSVFLSTLDDNGNPISAVRSVSTAVKDNKDNLYIDYPRLSYYGNDRTELKNSCMPDLVYDSADIGSFNDTWRKCYFNDNNFTALIYGGTYDVDTNPNDQYGERITSLNAGKYRITAMLRNAAGTQLASATKDIEVKYTAEKVLARFSPNNHMEKVLADAAEHNYTVYLDPFPGYWDPKNFIVGLESSGMFCEILPKWRLADRQEYEAGKVHYYVYNVKNTSATYNVETGELANDGALGKSRVAFLRYDIGDVSVGQTGSNYIDFLKDEYLRVTRIDFQDGASENVLDVTLLGTFPSTTNISGTTNVKLNQVFQVNTVCIPIPSATDLDDNAAFTILNRIASIEYAYMDSTGVVIKTENHDMTMNRINMDLNRLDYIDFLRQGLIRQGNPMPRASSTSVLEGRHNCSFNFTGSATLRLRAFDVNGVQVGTESLLAFNISN